MAKPTAPLHHPGEDRDRQYGNPEYGIRVPASAPPLPRLITRRRGGCTAIIGETLYVSEHNNRESFLA